MPGGDELRDRLRALGEQRRELDHAKALLAEEIRSTLERCRGRITMVEAATLVGLDRTALYRTYIYG